MTQTVAAKPWDQLSKEKQDALENSFPNEWRVPSNLLPKESDVSVLDWPETSGWFTAEELRITNLSLQKLLEKLTTGQLSSLDVTKAYCKRAVAAHQLVRVLIT
jgi:amidase